MHVDEEQLKDFLIESSLVSRSDIDNAEDQIKNTNTNINVGDYLVIQGKISDDELKKIQAHVLGVPFVNLVGQKILFDVLTIIPESISRNHNIIAYKKEGNKLEVAMLDTSSLSNIEFIKKKSSLSILPRLTSANSIRNALLQYQKELKTNFGDVMRSEVSSDQIVHTLFRHAILQNTSDIHIEPQEENSLIRYRINGTLYDAIRISKQDSFNIINQIKKLAELDINKKDIPQNGKFRIEIVGENVLFRVSALPIFYGEKMVIRILKENKIGYTLESLGFRESNIEKIHDSLKQKDGMILVTGPNNSGKSTVLYTLVDILNNPEVNISTIEDPIKFKIPRVNQTQTNSKLGLTFAEGLKNLALQDPDVIMISKIENKETASLAVNHSLANRLILSSLDSDSSAKTISKLTDFNISNSNLATSLKIIIVQRLVRKLGDQKGKYFLSKTGIESLRKIADLDKVLMILKKEKIVDENASWNKIPFYKSNKTKEHDGYDGKIGIQEVLQITPAIRDLIIKGVKEEEITKQVESDRTMTLTEDGIFKAVQGLTTVEEVFKLKK
jgi:type IV pilus assembly protein PilB